MRAREVVARLKADGWCQVGQNGGHRQFKHPTKPGKVTVPDHPGDIRPETIRSIQKQSGVRLLD